MAVRIVTDSACDLSSAETDELGIRVVPLTIRFGDVEYTDREELSADDFYAKMAESEALPQTAAPSPGAFEQVFRACGEEGADAVVCINLSSELSATMQAASSAKAALEGELDVRVLDSKSITSGLGTQVLRAAQAARDGAGTAEITSLIEDLSERTRVFGALDTLDNLKKGGRIGGAQALLGSMLSIKPVIDISTGKVEQAAKPRTRRKAMEWLRDRVLADGDIDGLCIAHGYAPDIGAFEEMMGEHFSRDQYRQGTIGPVIGAHGGPRVLGVTYLVR